MNHKHILVKATRLADPPRDPSAIIAWLTELVQKVDMVPLIPAQAIYCDDPGNEGVTGFIVIKTSHASIHVWSEIDEPFAQMDLYSCKEFVPTLVMSHFAQFRPSVCEAVLIDRNDELRTEERFHMEFSENGDVNLIMSTNETR